MFCQNCGNDCKEFKFCPECGCDLRTVNKPVEVFECVSESISAPEKICGVYGKNQEMKVAKDGLTLRENGAERLIHYSDVRKVNINRASPQKDGVLDMKLNDDSNVSVSFAVSENTSIFQVFLFLKEIAPEKEEPEKRNVAQEMIAAAQQARAYEKEKGYVPAYRILKEPETFSANELSWYPGKKKDDRKAKIAELEKAGEVYCPKCLSTKITAQKKGFGFIRGALGASVGIDVGMIAGGIGSNKILCTCMKCGYQWKPGKR